MARGNGNGGVVVVPSHLDGTALAVVKDSRRSRPRSDSWYNSRSRFGGSADPVIVSRYIRKRSRIDREEAEALYENSSIVGRAIDQLPWDATREWITLTHESSPEKAEKLRQEDDRLDGRGKFKEGLSWGRLHGGDLLVMGAWDGQDPEEELNLERIRKIQFVENVDRWLAFPAVWYRDEDEEKFGTVEIYQIDRLVPVGAPVIRVHESRTIKFDGNPLPKRALVRNWGWNASVLEKVYDDIRNWGITNQAAAATVPAFITIAMQIENLQQLIANQDWDVIQSRMNEMAAQLSINNMAFHGPGEQIQKLGTPIGGLPELMDRFMAIVSGALGIPKSILFQAESGSLGGNAAGIDVRNWHATVRACQNTYMRPKVRRWLDIIGIPLGLKPGEVEFEFAPLSVLTELEEAQVYQTISGTDAQNIQAGVIDSPERIAVFRMGGKTWKGGPPVLDTKRQEAFIEQLDQQEITVIDPKAQQALQLQQQEQQVQQGEMYLQQRQGQTEEAPGQEGGGGGAGQETEGQPTPVKKDAVFYTVKAHRNDDGTLEAEITEHRGDADSPGKGRTPSR